VGTILLGFGLDQYAKPVAPATTSDAVDVSAPEVAAAASAEQKA